MLRADAVCTVWRKAEQARVAVWTKTEVPCSWQPQTGSDRTIEGQESRDGIAIYVWDDGIRLGDYVTEGTTTATAPDNPYKVVERRRYTFNGKYHHTEAVAR